MRRAVITGIGIVSSIGNNKEDVTQALREGRSGITFSQQFADAGMRSQVWGKVDIDLDALIDRKIKRFMGDASGYAYVAMQQAIDDSGLSEEMISNIRTGIIAGSGGASSQNQVEAIDILREKGVKRIGPYM
ncbi:MAG: beta-ketoacyl-ACP synthase I, partial [Paraglaciecola sp.]|nr:beta-ketoacyl-ACP synthase I [Paraglaciecola sp.]